MPDIRRRIAAALPRLYAPPEGASRAVKRVFAPAAYAYSLGLVMHAAMLVAFAVAGVWPLAAFNLLSVAVFGAALVLHARMHLVAAGLISTAEVTAHQVLATVFLGSETGFYLYLPIPAMITLVIPALPRASRYILATAITALFVGMAVYGYIAPPLHPLSPNWSAGFLVFNTIGVPLLLCGIMVTFSRAATNAEAALDAAHQESESLLRNILPDAIARRLKRHPGVIGDRYEEASVLFADLVGFTEMSRRMAPEQLVALLDELVSEFDDLAARFEVEKIKTIGDAYMVAAGLPEPQADHAERLADLALEMRAAVSRKAGGATSSLRIRIGLNAGPVVAGVIGKRKFAYDLWGDTVNLAARMEATAEPDTIQVAPTAHALLSDHFQFTPIGMVPVKGVGDVETYLLEGRIERKAA